VFWEAVEYEPRHVLLFSTAIKRFSLQGRRVGTKPGSSECHFELMMYRYTGIGVVLLNRTMCMSSRLGGVQVPCCSGAVTIALLRFSHLQCRARRRCGQLLLAHKHGVHYLCPLAAAAACGASQCRGRCMASPCSSATRAMSVSLSSCI
jgi:hypothetical protein